MKKLVVENFVIKTGGEIHTGWLPNQATKPLPTPINEILSDLAIEELEGNGGFLLLYESKDGKYSGDTWHRSIGESMRIAEENFGIPKSLWKEAK